MKPIYSLVLVTTLSHTVQVGARLAVMLYGVHLGASAATVGVLSALFSAVNVFTSVPVGRWIDRSGARVPMLLSAVMVTVGAAVGFLFDGLSALFAVGLLIGSFYNLTFIAQQRLAGQYGGPEERVNNFSIVSLGQSAASTAGPVLTGFVIEHAGYGECFMMFTAFAGIALVAMLFGLIVFPPSEPRPVRTGVKRAGTLDLLKGDRQLRRMYVLAVVASSTWSIVVFLIPLYGTQIGLGPVTIGIIIGSFSVATIAVRMALPALSRRLTPWRLLIASLLLSAIAFLPIPFFTAVIILNLLAAMIGMGLGLCGPVSQAILYDISPPDRVGELLGLRATLLNLSHGGMPVISGALSSTLGVGPVFWLIAACLFGCGWYIREEWNTPARTHARKA